MKARHIIALVVLALAAGLFVASCGILGTSIDSRIASFVDSLNSDRTQTYRNLVPDSAIYLANTGVADLWDANFPSTDGPFSLSMLSSSPYVATDVQVNMDFTGASITKKYKFVFQNEGSYFEEWYVSNIYVYSAGAGTWTSLFGIP